MYFKKRKAIKEFELLLERMKDIKVYQSTFKFETLKTIEKYFGKDSVDFNSFKTWDYKVRTDGSDSNEQMNAMWQTNFDKTKRFIEMCISDISRNGLRDLSIKSENKESWTTRHPFLFALIIAVISALLGYGIPEIVKSIQQDKPQQKYQKQILKPT
jgi:hypothetical protein